jgi:hypothetical protein
MRAIRRFYFYLVALISLEVVLWGLIGLLRTIFEDKTFFPDAETLAGALALVLVGVPIFLFHWLWGQRAAARDAEEQTSSIRAVFLYAALLVTLIPFVQNLLALINRTFLQVTGQSVSRAFLGGGQSLADNLIAMTLNTIAAAYFFNILRAAWGSQSDEGQENFAGVRRLYRYTWLLYSLLMTIIGLQQTLRFVLFTPGAVLGVAGRYVFINGLSLILVGAPLWFFTWWACQDALQEPRERGSILRMAVLYLLSLAGVGVVLGSAGLVLYQVLLWLLGARFGPGEFLQAISGPVSIGIPLAMVWAYYGAWFQRDAESLPDVPRRFAVKRLYYYLLAPAGLVASVIGINLLLSYLLDVTLGGDALLGESSRYSLASALATLAAGLPLWLLAWGRMQTQALQAGEIGDHSRRSVIRRAFLYFVIFGAVIGGMGSAVGLAYQLLNALLGGRVPAQFLVDVLELLKLVLIFVGLLAYHISVLRRDGQGAADALAARYREFPVLVFEREGSGFGAAAVEALRKQSGELAAVIQQVEQPIPEEAAAARVVLLPGGLALDPPEALRLWLKAYDGQRVVVPEVVPGWNWAASVTDKPLQQAAQLVRKLADGEEIRLASGASAWTVVLYLFAGLFILQWLFGLLMFGISLFTGF